jgi:hypothetical protein
VISCTYRLFNLRVPFLTCDTLRSGSESGTLRVVQQQILDVMRTALLFCCLRNRLRPLNNVRPEADTGASSILPTTVSETLARILDGMQIGGGGGGGGEKAG